MPIQALRSVSDHFDAILRHVKPKRLALEMARADKAFHFRNFKGYRLDKIGRGRIKKIAEREILKGDGHELFANLIIVHWNEANAGLYEEMVTHVKTINEDVEAIERIEPAKAHAIIDDMLERHAREMLLVCVRLNGVRFDEEVIGSRLERGEPAPSAEELAAAAAAAAADESAAETAVAETAAAETAAAETTAADTAAGEARDEEAGDRSEIAAAGSDGAGEAAPDEDAAGA